MLLVALHMVCMVIRQAPHSCQLINELCALFVTRRELFDQHLCAQAPHSVGRV